MASLLMTSLRPLAARAGSRAAPALASVRRKRPYSTETAVKAAPLIVVSNNADDGVATISLSSKPVNSLTQEVCEGLRAELRALEADPLVRGVLLTSAVPNVFSAGLDLRSMHGKSDGELAEFWTSVQEMWFTLYTTPLATVASISGHAPAGGCLLSLACDYRVMVEGKFRIGLNESQIGIVAPFWLSRMLLDTVGFRRAERMLQLGSLLSPDDALAAGLVDEVVPLHKLPGASAAALDELLAINDGARAVIKRQLRASAADTFREKQSEDLDQFINIVQQPAVQGALGAYIASLGKGKKE